MNLIAMLAVNLWSWSWLAIGGIGTAIETVALVKNKNGTLSRNLRRITGGNRKWPAIAAWAIFAIWFPLHLWVFTPATSNATHPTRRTPHPTTTTSRSTTCRLGDLPDTSCTPGATNPAVTQATIHQTICVPGWTATVRPPVNVTDPIKIERMRAYGIAGKPKTNYELDHLIPLEVGGAPTAVTNLWPEPYAGNHGAHVKDLVENRLKAEICSGKISLTQAQHAIATNWETTP